MSRRSSKKAPAALLKAKAVAAAAVNGGAANGHAAGGKDTGKESSAGAADATQPASKPVDEAKLREQALKNRVLAKKEQTEFRQLLQLYELKQHKRAIKTADGILKKHPNHGETLALKALVIHSSLPYNHPTATSQPKGEEAESLIAAALRKDPYSHIVHHVNSIMRRAAKDFDGSAQSLRKARELDPENFPLIRDSISLFTQLGDHDESLRARHQQFVTRPMIRQNWVTLAIGHELKGDYEEALRIYAGLDEATKDEGMTPLERGELSLHVIKVMTKAGNLQEALERLEDDVRDRILPDEAETIETQAQILEALGRTEDAEIAYRKLLQGNPDNLGWYKDVLRIRGIKLDQELTDEQREKVLVLLDGFRESYPRAMGPARLALTVARGSDFKTRAKSYIVSGLDRAIPSLFVDMKGLYNDAEKLETVEEIVLELESTLEAEASGNSSHIAPPTALLWLYYYLALHFSHRKHPSPDYERSLRYLQTAIQHTPTLPELYMAKAMVLKRAGDPEYAARVMEQARLLDGQDRFLNSKAGKYWIRADEVQRAEQILELFTKKDVSALQDLTDMQCLWFLQEEGDAYLRLGRHALALKRYRSVVEIFEDMNSDRFDFHTYSIRKTTLNAYSNLTDWAQTFRSHPRLVKCGLAAVRLLLQIHDHPEMREQKLSPEQEAERKRALKKAKQAENKAKKATSAEADGKKDEPSLPDSDPEGLKYLKDVDALKEAESILKTLGCHASSNAEILALSAEVSLRQADKASEKQSALIASGLGRVIPEGMDIIRFNDEFIQRNSGSARHQLTGAQALHVIQTLNRSADSGDSSVDLSNVVAQLMQVASPSVSPDLTVYREALSFMANQLEASEPKLEELRAAIRKRVPMAKLFATMAEISARRQKWLDEESAVPSNDANDI